MGSRLYFPNALAAPAGVAPAYDASWGITATAVRRKLMHKPTNDGSHANSRSVAETSATPINGLVDQYISDPLPFNKEISGTVLASVKGRGAGGTGYLRVVVKVVSNTGEVKATLFTGVSVEPYGGNAPFDTCVVGGSLTTFAAVAGDRIVVERGAYFNNTTTASQSIALSANTDFAYEDGAPTYRGDASDITMTRRPWIEFSQNDIWGSPKPTVASENVEVAEQPVRTPTELSSAITEVAEKPVRTPTKLSAILVNALVPRAGQIAEAIYAAGFPNREPRVKLPDGRWVPLRPARPAQDDRPIMTYSNYSSNRSVVLGSIPTEDEFLVLMTSSKDAVPKALTGPPSGIPGVTWTEVHRDLDDRHAIWFGTGATGTGTATISAFSAEASYQRITSIFIVRGAKKNLGYQKGAFVLNSSPAILTPEVSGQDQISFVSAVAGSTNPAPVIAKTPDWVTLRPGNIEVQLGRATPHTPNDVSSELSISHSTGVSGLLAVIGGKDPYTPPVEGPPIVGTTRYYMQTVSTTPMPTAYSSKWLGVPSSTTYQIGASTLPSLAATGNQGATRPSAPPGSTAAFQMMLPSVRAGVINGSFRFVWPVEYIGEAYMRLIIRLISADGQTVRGELADVTSTKNADGSVYYGTSAVSGALAPLVAQRGDRIAVEGGFHFVVFSGGSAAFGQVAAANNGDYPFQDDVVYDNTKRGWFELIAN